MGTLKILHNGPFKVYFLNLVLLIYLIDLQLTVCKPIIYVFYNLCRCTTEIFTCTATFIYLHIYKRHLILYIEITKLKYIFIF